MTDNPPAILPAPAPIPLLPPPPAEVSDAIAAAAVACDKWAPTYGVNEAHKTEVHFCDVALNRDVDFSLGVCAGVAAALASVAFLWACRSAIRQPAFTKSEEAAAILFCCFLAVPVGFAANLLAQLFNPTWSGHLFGYGAALGAAAGLILLRWLAQASAQQAAAA